MHRPLLAIQYLPWLIANQQFKKPSSANHASGIAK
jgi:hypothetical protein